MRGWDKMILLSIVVPVYCNQQSLQKLFSKIEVIEQALNEIDIQLELIFVDDGSIDDSYAELRKIKEKRDTTKIIKLTRNFGAISAVKTGIEYCTGDALVFLAADLQDPPELIIDMVKEWRNGHKYVIAVRESRDDPYLSTVFSRVYYKLLRKIVVPEYPHTGFDLALMDKQFLPYLKRVSKHVNFPLFPFWLGFSPKKIFYHRHAREHGKSKWTFLKKTKLLFDSILGFNFMPIRLITLVGILVSLTSLSYGLIVIGSALLGKIPVPGFATMVVIITFLLSLIIVMLGLIGEYVWRIFDEIHNNPVSVIEEIL